MLHHSFDDLHCVLIEAAARVADDCRHVLVSVARAQRVRKRAGRRCTVSLTGWHHSVSMKVSYRCHSQASASAPRAASNSGEAHQQHELLCYETKNSTNFNLCFSFIYIIFSAPHAKHSEKRSQVRQSCSPNKILIS